jgi:hypothetical protein
LKQESFRKVLSYVCCQEGQKKMMNMRELIRGFAKIDILKNSEFRIWN